MRYAASGHHLARPWPEAERIFRADDRWRGADNGYTVALGGDRTLWLFADSFVADPPGPRAQARPVWGNTIAVMTGLDPATASMRFHWRERGGAAAAFFAPPQPSDGRRLVMWPGHGIRLDQGLLLFFQLVEFRFAPGDDDEPESFHFVGWAARFVENPDDDPPRWRVRELEAPQNPYGVVVGSAQVLRHGDHVYAYGADPTEPIRAYLARWPRASAEHGDLTDPQWWCGPDLGWLPQSAVPGTPAAIITDAKTEFTVHADPAGGFVQMQGGDYFSAQMLIRRSPTLVGPWSAPEAVYDPPERAMDRVALYAFKAHPHLSGADLVASYVALPADRDLLLGDERLYRPRLVRLTLR